MGAGNYALGQGPAGLDPVLPPSPGPSLGRQPSALKFDLTKRAWVINADGSMASVHPVDSRVVIALGFELGTIPSANAIGNTLRTSIPRIIPTTLQAQVNDAVHRALDAMVLAGEISIDAINVWPGTNGYIAQVVYTNLQTQQQNTVTT